MVKNILSDLRDYLLTGTLKDNSLKIRTDQRNYKDAGIYEDKLKKLRHFKFFFDHLNDISHEYRRDYIVRDGKYHEQQNKRKAFIIRLCIRQKAHYYLGILHISVESDRFLLLAYSHIRNYKYYRQNSENSGNRDNWVKFSHFAPPSSFAALSSSSL